MATINGTAGADNLYDTLENDTIDGGAGNDVITLSLGGIDNVFAGAGFDTLVIDWSALTHAISAVSAPTANPSGGSDGQFSGGGRSVTFSQVERLDITGGAGADTITGGRGNDSLKGGAGDDLLTGGGGHDRLEGGANIDRLVGGTGNDTYVVDLQDTLFEAAGQGIDTAFFIHNGGTLTIGVENLVGASGNSQLLVGNALNNIVQGGAMADTIKGAAGDDLLLGGGGGDNMEGGDGRDIMLAGGLGAELIVNGSFETVNGSDVSADWALAGGTSAFGIVGRQTATLHGWQKSGAGDFELLAWNGNDQFNSGDGDTVLDMESAAGQRQTIFQDIAGLTAGTHLVLTFAAGRFAGENNVATLDVVWNGSVVATITPAGIEMTQHSVLVTAAQGTNRLEFREQAPGADGRGTMLDAVSLKPVLQTGETVRNTLLGNGGDDVLVGDDAADELIGGLGADVMIGGAGDDIYSIDTLSDVIVEAAGGGARDKVTTTLASYTLPDHIELLSGLSAAGQTLVGNALSNQITGSDGADRLDGGAGIDLLMGLGGNDTYVINDLEDSVNEFADGGSDTIETGLAAFTLVGRANVENLTGTNAAGQVLTGSAGANRIQGAAGNDTLNGNGGADTLAGGAGDDVYLIDSMDDVIEEAAGAGSDEVRTAMGSRTDYSLMYTLADGVEKFTGTSTGSQGVHLNALDNVAIMGGGNDLVALHQGGNDYVDGGAGNDFLYFGATFDALDVVIGGAGIDTVGLIGSYDLVLGTQSLQGVERLAIYTSGDPAAPNNYVLTTVDGNVAAGGELMVAGQSLTANERLVFNGQAESDGSFNIRGGKGSDALTGGAMADRIYGNFGADTLKGGAGADMFDYFDSTDSTAAACDTILDFSAEDWINLWEIDADGNAANGNSAFSWIGAGAFGGIAGQLRATQVQGGGFLVEADSNGDAVADLVILVQTTAGHILGAGDFNL